MLLDHKKVAIIGGGPGGLTLAALLQQAGADVSVYERDLNRDARVQGSTLDLHDTSGLAALRRAGLIEEFKKNFLPRADRLKIMNENAETLHSDHDTKVEENFGHEHFRPEIDRGALRHILLGALHPDTVIWDSHFISMEKEGIGWLLHFRDKPDAYADLVIAADGANSKLRPYITDSRPVYSGILMLEGNIYDVAQTAPHIHAMLQGGKIMAFGKGRDILMGQKGHGEVGFYLSFRAAENWPAESGLDFSDRAQLLAWFQKEYAGWSPVWQELLTAAAIPFIPRPIYAMPMDQHWAAQPALTMIGDAAHVMPPFAGEGVNMAMLDALELSDALLSGTHATIAAAIAAYEAHMRPRAAAIIRESLDNGERMHSDQSLEIMLSFFAGH